MGDNPNIKIFWPAGPDGKKVALPLPYYIALVSHAPHSANGKKLIDWLLSKEAQSKVVDIAQGIPVREDVHRTGKAYETIQSSLTRRGYLVAGLAVAAEPIAAGHRGLAQGHG